MQFSLWDAAGSSTPPMGGAQIGITQELPVTVTNGLFTAVLNSGSEFGGNAFTGEARWLQIAVRCPARSGEYTTLSPRQAVTPAPYALYSSGNWGIDGNRGTSAANFLGTTGNMKLTLAVSNMAALQLIPAPGAPIVIGGYAGNAVGGLGDGATIAGGGSSYWGANIITGTNVTWATIGGGVANRINGNAYQATIGGGYQNVISGTNADRATIGGGWNNTVSGAYSTVGGGWGNTASSFYSTIGEGYRNTIDIFGNSVIGGGWGNMAVGGSSTISGGANNTTSGTFATIPGGSNNMAAGDFSFAAGHRAEALHQGSFVWADSSDADFASTGNNQFLVRANGGVGINTNVPSRTLDVNGIIGVFDGGTRTYYGGLASEVGGQLVELGINDDVTNRFGGAYNSTAQGGLFRIDARAGQNIFQFYGRPAGSLSLNLVASLNNAGVLAIGGLGSAGSTSLCLNASSQISTCSSSARYKDNIESLPLGLDAVARLRPVTFNWKTDGEPDLGFVAEEANQVSPLLTTLNKDGQIEGVKYDRISAILVKAVQEQQQQIAE